MQNNPRLYKIFLITVTVASSLAIIATTVTLYQQFKKKKCKCTNKENGD